MTATVARGLGIGFFVSISLLVPAARGEVFEVPLPTLEGSYSMESLGTQQRFFRLDLGFPLAEVHDVRFRVEGTAVGPFVSGPFDRPARRDAFFGLLLEAEVAHGPSAGKATYPGPESFVGEVGFLPPVDWSFLKGGVASGLIYLSPAGQVDFESTIVGGSATITGAWLIIEGTPVPEASALAVVVVGAGGLLRRRSWLGTAGLALLMKRRRHNR